MAAGPGPKVLVTGAAGRLGRVAAGLLHREGYDLVATDLVMPDSTVSGADDQPPYRFDQADLRDHEAARQVLDGIDVVVHIANHPGLGVTPPQVVFNENVAVNENVFQGAAEQGVGRIIFASTVQLVGSRIDDRTVINEPSTPDYPLNGTTTPDPSNVYALSKTVSEVMLRYYADRCGIDCVALRLPMLHYHEERVIVATGREQQSDIIEGFSGLSYADAAALVLAVIRSDLPGYRVYAPGTSHRHRDLTVPELVRAFYPGVPADIPDLIDGSTITEETGWRPGDDYHRPAGGRPAPPPPG